MPLSKIRFVTACQQILALAVVLAVLTPAASVISLDVAHETPVDGLADAPTSDIRAELRASTRELRDGDCAGFGQVKRLKTGDGKRRLLTEGKTGCSVARSREAGRGALGGLDRPALLRSGADDQHQRAAR